jgi:hypothetical protein
MPSGHVSGAQNQRQFNRPTAEGKSKVVLMAMPEDESGSEGTAPPFFTPAIDGGEWKASSSSRFTLEERIHGTHCIGGLAGRGTCGLNPRANYTDRATTACQRI